MSKTTIKLEVPFEWNWLLSTILREEMKRLWQSSIFMAEQGYGKDYWKDRIDQTADMMIQLQAQGL